MLAGSLYPDSPHASNHQMSSILKYLYKKLTISHHYLLIWPLFVSSVGSPLGPGGNFLQFEKKIQRKKDFKYEKLFSSRQACSIVFQIRQIRYDKTNGETTATQICQQAMMAMMAVTPTSTLLPSHCCRLPGEKLLQTQHFSPSKKNEIL